MKWPEDIGEAKKIQDKLRNRVKIIPLRKSPKFIAGVDAAFLEDKVIGTVCLYTYPDLIFIKEAYAVTKSLFPYIPGFLSFREGPAIIDAIRKLKIRPDLILFDGQGIAHPKGMGIATHLGILLDIPTIGCAKSRLIGDYRDPGHKKGEWSHIEYKGRVVGAVLRTKGNVKPLFISPGHRIDLRGSIELILGSLTKYRIPEPLRRADSISKKIKTFFNSNSYKYRQQQKL